MAENDDISRLIDAITAAVSPQVTDAVTQTSVATLGNGPALSSVQSYLSLAQAQGVLFANMLNNHQQLSIAGQAATIEGVIKILKMPPG